jgi:hypothetical protein
MQAALLICRAIRTVLPAATVPHGSALPPRDSQVICSADAEIAVPARVRIIAARNADIGDLLIGLATPVASALGGETSCALPLHGERSKC